MKVMAIEIKEDNLDTFDSSGFVNILKKYSPVIKRVEKSEALNKYIYEEIFFVDGSRIGLNFLKSGQCAMLDKPIDYTETGFLTRLDATNREFYKEVNNFLKLQPNKGSGAAMALFDMFVKTLKKLNENKLRNFIRNAFGKFNEFDMKKFSEELMSFAPMIQSIEEGYGDILYDYAHSYFIKLKSGLKLFACFENDGSLDYVQQEYRGNPTFAPPSPEQFSEIKSFWDEWSSKSVNAKGANEAETIFKTFMNLVNRKNKKPSALLPESKFGLPFFSIKKFSKNLMELLPFIDKVKNDDKVSSEFHVYRIYFKTKKEKPSDEYLTTISWPQIVNFVFEKEEGRLKQVIVTSFGRGDETIKDNINNLSSLTINKVETTPESGQAHNIFKMFMRVANSKNKKGLRELDFPFHKDDEVVQPQFEVKKFGTLLKSLSKYITSIKHNRTIGATSSYVICTNDLDMRITFKNGMLYSISNTGAAFDYNPEENKASRALTDFINSKDNPEIGQEQAEAIFKTFMNVINSRKKLTENTENTKPSHFEKFSTLLKDLGKYVIDISQEEGYGSETHIGQVNRYRMTMRDDTSILIDFDNGELWKIIPQMSADSEMNKKTWELERLYRIYPIDSSADQEETIFKTFINLVKSKNK